VAQAVLTVHTPDAVRRALVTEDLVALCLVPGIGKKGAQRLVLELKDKAGLPTAGAPVAAATGWRDTLTSALVGLGWTGPQADEVVVRLAGEHPSATDADVPVLLREALGQLGRAR
jgi:Holliday junction DNA helicase RuvA